MAVNDKSERMCEEAVVYFEILCQHCQEILRKATEILSQDIWSPV